MEWSGEIVADDYIPTTAYSSGRDGHSVRYIVVHHEAAIGLGGAAITRMWNNMQAQSAHYSIDSNGTVTQHVLESNTAWACGNWVANCESISIEHANNNSNPWTVAEPTLESGAHLVAALLVKYSLGYPEWGGNVRPHKQIVATACPGELAGSQNAHFMERCRYWYEVMTGSRSENTVGWHSDGKGSWWYQTGASSSEYAIGWYKIGTTWYYFNASGWMMTGWVHASWQDGPKEWWYCNSDGAMEYDKWISYNGGWYLLASDGHMLNGWVERDGKTYFLDGSGRMVSGWYHDTGDGRDIWYFFEDSGALVYDCVKEVGAGKICAFNKDGHLIKGEITVETDNSGYLTGIKE